MAQSGEVGAVWWTAHLDNDQLRSELNATNEELKRTGRVGGDALGDGMEQGAKEGAAAVRAESKKAADATEKNLGGAANRVREGFTNVQKALAAIGIGIGLATVTTFMSASINAASDLNEELSKTEVVFGRASDKVVEFSKHSDQAMGQSQRQALGAAGAFGNMFKTIGFADDAAADMSMTMVQLASDMASFNNQDPSEMLERLRSGLAGEAEPLRQFGVLISEARVKAKAYELGIAEAGAELTEQQKVVARYNLILEDTALQQGDFARTSDGLANSQRQLAAQWENAQARIGKALMPVAEAMVNLASDVVPHLVDGFLSLIDVLKPLATGIGTVAGLWVEHADVILPAVAVMLVARVVPALKLAADNADLLDVALRGIRAAALLLLPMLPDIARALDIASVEMTQGKERADLLADAMDHMATTIIFGSQSAELRIARLAQEADMSFNDMARLIADFGDSTGKSLEFAEEMADKWGMSVSDVLRNASTAILENGMTWDDWAAAVEQSLAGAVNPETVKNWDAIIAANTGGVPGAISGPFEQGADDAVSAIDDMFARIAAAIAAREQELRDAGGNAVDAWLEPQTLGYQIASLEAELASQDLRDKLASSDPDIKRDAEQRRLEITAELVKLRQAQATTGDEMSQIAAQKSLLTSQFMKEGLLSEDPEIRALFQDWKAKLEESIEGMETDAERNRAGHNMARKIIDETPEVHDAIRNLTGVRPDTSWAYDSGYKLGSRFHAGFSAWLEPVKQVSLDLGANAAVGIRMRSPAKEGALSEPASNWSRKLIADFLGPLRTEGLAEAAAASRRLAGMVAGGLQSGALAGDFGFAAGGAAAGADVSRGTVVYKREVHLHTQGPTPVSTDDDLTRLLDRTQWIAEDGAWGNA